MTTDPAVRYTAGGILLAAFVGCLAVVVHGFWDNPNYTIPAAVQAVLFTAVSGALTLLGVHVGGSGIATGAQVASTVQRQTIENGTIEPASKV